MWLKNRLQRNISMKVYELQYMMIVTLLLTLFLINVWPRFRSDALSIQWYWYLVLTFIFSIPFYKRVLKK